MAVPMVRPSALLGVWCLLVAVSMATEMDSTEQVVSLEVAEAKQSVSAGKLYNGVPKEDLEGVTQMGLRNLGLWKQANSEQKDTNNKLLKRLSTPWKTKMAKDCCKYNRIPWFKLGFMGKEVKDQSKGDCQAICNKYIGCKSFSYSFKERLCIWAPEAVNYDQNWRFYSKKDPIHGKPDGTYHMFPGMKFLEPTTNVEKDKSLQECMYSCTKELGCASFSYSEPLAECARSGQNIGYGENWQYFEKDLSDRKKPSWKEKHDKENEMKDKLKKDYMNDIDKHRLEEEKEEAKETNRKASIEKQLKIDGKQGEKTEKTVHRAEKAKARAKARTKKTQDSAEKLAGELRMATLNETKNVALMESLKQRISELDPASQERVDLAQQATKLDTFMENQKKMIQEKQSTESAEKQKFVEADAAEKAKDEKEQKSEQKERQTKFDGAMDKEKKEMEAKEAKEKNCAHNLQKTKAELVEATRMEKRSKSKMANEEGMVEKWTTRAQMATNEAHNKQYTEFVQESKENLDKATASEQEDVKKEMKAQKKENDTKEKCKKKVKKELDSKEKFKKDEGERTEKMKKREEAEKRQIKENAMKVKENDAKETETKEKGMKDAHVAAKKERVDKISEQQEQTLKVKMQAVEKEQKETNAKQAKQSKKIQDEQAEELKLKADTRTKRKTDEGKFKMHYLKESKSKEKASKDSAKMTTEQNNKAQLHADEKIEKAKTRDEQALKELTEAKDEKMQKTAEEKKSKAEENIEKEKMRRPRLTAVQRNDAGMVKVPVPGGTTMVGGGLINHYRKWNEKSIFEESYPDGDTWRCDTGVGDEGQLTCISLAYRLPKGTKCVNRRVYTPNAGVIHAVLPPGYTMVSGGVQNLHRRFDKHGAFEESMPAGDRKWRCDMGFGRGELNCFVRGCKFPHGAHCVTTEGSSNEAGWVWAECPHGYSVMGCGMRNNYLQFDPASGFEDLRPVGNKCMGDMGFGPGRVSVFARCCKVEGAPPEIPAPEKNDKIMGKEKCIMGSKWDMVVGKRCGDAPLQSMELSCAGPVCTGTEMGQKLEQCTNQCLGNNDCKSIEFPPKDAEDARCHLMREEKCTNSLDADGWTSFSTREGSCTDMAASIIAGVVIKDRRRRQDVSRRRGGKELGEEHGGLKSLGESDQFPPGSKEERKQKHLKQIENDYGPRLATLLSKGQVGGADPSFQQPNADNWPHP